MKELKKRIPLKYIYVLSACIAILLSVGLYYTYAMFTANVSSGNVVNMDTTITYKFDINGTQNIHVGKNSVASFNVLVTNTTSGTIYYEIYYDTSNDLTNVIIGEVVEDKTVTTIAPNTSGVLEKDKSITVPLVIANNSNSDTDITIGVVTGYVGNTINYGTDNYPNGTKITNTYNLSDITNSCEGGTNAGDNCIVKLENGIKTTYCETSSEQVSEDPSGANRPVLAEGMIPITYDGTNWIKVDKYGNYSNWYDYGNQKWANAVMVTSSKRDTYMNADIGTVVPEADILAYYVWIPRYKYKLFNATYASGTSAQLIDVVFESGTSTTGTVTCSYSAVGAETCTNKTNGNYYTHPAFTFGDAELFGIWVGKFETTGSTTTPTVKPGITSLTNITKSSMYNTSKLFNSISYLTNTGTQNADAHMMKNIEWGAVAYLKQSIYGLGITDIIKNNNFNGYITGGGSGTSYKSNLGQSTTGNITGIYDMSAGAHEIVMGNYRKTVGNSGLTMSAVPTKHIDIYAGDSVRYSHLGDALGETAGWYNDLTLFVSSYNPWFSRGGRYMNDAEEGVFSFFYGWTTGEDSNTSEGFRTVLSIK